LTDILYEINDLEIKIKAISKDENTLLSLLDSNHEKIQSLVVDCMAYLYGGHYRNYYFENIYNGNLVEASIGALMRIYGNKILDEIAIEKCTHTTVEIIKEYKEQDKEME
jgi:hypothetical protein